MNKNIEKHIEALDDIMLEADTALDSLNQAETSCGEADDRQSDAYHVMENANDDCGELDDLKSEVQEACDNCNVAINTAQEHIGEGQDVLRKLMETQRELQLEFAKMLEPSWIVKVAMGVRDSIKKIFSYRLSVKVTRK